MKRPILLLFLGAGIFFAYSTVTKYVRAENTPTTQNESNHKSETKPSTLDNLLGAVNPAPILNAVNPLKTVKKATIAVGPIYVDVTRRDNNAQIESFRDMLTTSFAHSGKFDVIERDRLTDVFREMGLNQTQVHDQKAFDQLTTAELGKLKGVDYLFLGSITQFAITPRSLEKGINATQVGSQIAAAFLHSQVAMPEQSARVQLVANMAVDMKIIEVSTGKVIVADAVQAYQAGSFHDANTQDPNEPSVLTGMVMRSLSQDIVKRISVAIYPIKVANVEGDNVTLNYGDSILAPGNVLDVYLQQGGTITDPDTGEVLGHSEEKIGLLRVDSVERKFSKGTILAGKEKIVQGAICKVNPSAKIEKTQLEAQS